MSRPSVSIIIVNWNGWHFMPTCMAALAAQTVTDFEVIVVDNASTDGSVASIRRDYPHVRLIENTANVGFAVANNQALAHCRGRHIALLNNDTAADPGWLAALLGALAAHPRAAGACGTVVALDDPGRVIFTLPKIDPVSARAVWVNAPAPLTTVDYLAGNSMLVRREVIDRIGFLDPAYLAYFEETDWCARAIRAGYDLLYVPEAVVAHKEMGSAPGDFHAFQMERNRLRFALKNFDLARLPRFAVAYALDAARAVARNQRDGRPADSWLLARAVAWNLRALPATWAARRRDLGRLGPRPRSYNRSLPLRHRISDGQGGIRPGG
jgi:GT2 family glycosyltransferase